MTTTAKPMKRAALALLAGLALVGCGNDTGGLETLSVLRAAGGDLVGAVTPGRKPAAAPATPEQQAEAMAKRAASALRTIQGPVIMANIPVMGGTAILGGIGESNGVRTYATPSEQQMMLRGGVLTGTRGLGRDLMSADTAAAGALIRAARAGTAPRVQRYLDGDWRERPLNLTCEIRPQGAIAAGGISGTRVTETCTGGGAKIENSYVVAGGQIVASRQWLGPDMGYAEIQVLRP